MDISPLDIGVTLVVRETLRVGLRHTPHTRTVHAALSPTGTAVMSLAAAWQWSAAEWIRAVDMLVLSTLDGMTLMPSLSISPAFSGQMGERSPRLTGSSFPWRASS